MATIIRNKLKIIPNSVSKEEYYKQLSEVEEYCSAIEDGTLKIISFNKISPKPISFISESKEEDDWYLKNWGTRFKPLNSCWISDEEMIYDTFWNPSIPIILKLINKFKNVDFKFKFASKRTGTKTGEIIASNGKIIKFNRFENYSKEAYETAFELMPHLKMFYTLNQKTGTYEYDTSDFMMQIAQNGFYKEDDGTVLIGCDDKKKPLFDNVNDLPF